MQNRTLLPSNRPVGLGKAISFAAAGMLVLIVYSVYQIAALFRDTSNLAAFMSDQVPLEYKLACLALIAGAVAVAASALRAMLLIWMFRRNAAKAAIQHYLVLIAFGIEEVAVAVVIDHYSAANFAADAIGHLLATGIYAMTWIVFFRSSNRARRAFTR